MLTTQSSALSRTVRVISYNLKYHLAYGEVAELAQNYQADVVCLQECHTAALDHNIGKWQLAGKAASGRRSYGLAIYVDRRRFEILRVSSFALPPSLYERLILARSERLIVAKLYDRATKSAVSVASFHAAHLLASNHIRRLQVQAALSVLLSSSQDHPVIMVGDYNYPFFVKGLLGTVTQAGGDLALSDKPTFRNRFLTGYFDFAVSARVNELQVTTLPNGASDHMPILVEAF
jgi:endonuclease/exonuclease/phosphatase family metal-dependent hydrolase